MNKLEQLRTIATNLDALSESLSGEKMDLYVTGEVTGTLLMSTIFILDYLIKKEEES